MKKYIENISYHHGHFFRFCRESAQTPPDRCNLVWRGNPMENLKKWLKSGSGCVAGRDPG